MILYLSLFCCLLYIFLQFNDTARNRNLFLILVTIILTLVSGLRHPEVGNDTVNYLRAFDEAPSLSWNEIFESFRDAYFNPSADSGKDPGLMIYNKVLSGLLPSHSLYLLFTAAWLLVPLALFLKKHVHSLNSLLFIYLMFISIYYVYLPNSALRQSVALGILFCSFNILTQSKKTLLFIACVAFASIFHKSSLLALLMLLPRLIKSSKAIYWIGLPLLLCMYMEYNVVGVFLASQSDIYSMYAADYYSYGQTKPFIILLFFSGLYTLGLFVLNKYIINNQTSELSKFAICGTVFTVVFTPLILLDPSLIRITAYFVIWFMVFIPEIINQTDKKLSPMIFVVCIFLFLYKAYKSGGDYMFFWETPSF